jgi:hypothetical protein
METLKKLVLSILPNSFLNVGELKILVIDDEIGECEWQFTTDNGEVLINMVYDDGMEENVVMETDEIEFCINEITLKAYRIIEVEY